MNCRIIKADRHSLKSEPKKIEACTTCGCKELQRTQIPANRGLPHISEAQANNPVDAIVCPACGQVMAFRPVR